MKNEDFDIPVHIKHAYMNVHKYLPQKLLQTAITIHFIKIKTNVQKERTLLSFEAFCSNT